MTELLERIAKLAPHQRAALERRLQTRRREPPPAIGRRTRGAESFPLSFGQQRLWLLHQLHPGSSDYNIHGAIRLTGALSLSALERSFGEIVRRHEVLRATFTANGGDPRQRTAPPPVVVVPIVDLSALSRDRRGSELERRIAEDARRPFDLEHGPAYRFTLLCEGFESHVLVLTVHHIVADNWSIEILLRELLTLYRALVDGEPSPLGELPCQYGDFAQWQRRSLSGEVLEKELAFWKERLGGELPVLHLAPDRARRTLKSKRGARRARKLSPELSGELRELARRQGVTLFMTLLAVLKTLVFHYAHEDDVLVGTTLAERNHPDLEGLIGFFVNILVLRTDLSGNPSFLELLARVRATTLAAFAHNQTPFDKLVEELQPERDMSRFPIVQVGFEMMAAPQSQPAMPDLVLEAVEIEGRRGIRSELMLRVTDLVDGLECSLEYSTDLFAEPEIERMLEHFEALAASLVRTPEAPLKRLALFRDDIAASLGIPASRLERLAALTRTQRDIYLADLIDPERGTFIMVGYVDLGPDLDTHLWRRATERVVRENEMTRTRLSTYRGEVYQFVDTRPPFNFRLLELAAGDPHGDDPDALVERVIREPYEIHMGELVRNTLIRNGSGHYLAILAVHHVLLDGYSAKLFFEQVGAAYQAFRDDRPSKLRTGGSFFDHVEETLGRFDTPEIEAYWRDRLGAVVPLKELTGAIERPRPAVRKRLLDPAATRTLREFSQASGCRLPALCLGIYGALLNRFYDPPGDFVVYQFLGGRSREHFETLGCFYYVIPVVFPRARFASGSSAGELLDYAGRYHKELGPRQSVSLFLQRKILGDDGLKFYFNFYRFGLIEMMGEKLGLYDHNAYEDDEAHLVVRDMGDRLELKFCYDENHFTDLGFLDRYVNLLEQVAAGAAHVQGLEILLAGERHRLLVERNDTGRPFPADACFPELFEAQVRRTPDAIAAADRGAVLSYRELDRRSGRLASRLQAEGVDPDVVVALLAERSVDFLTAILALFKAGGAYLPLDPRHPAERWLQIFEQAHVPLVLAGEKFLPPLSAALASAPGDRPRVLPLRVERESGERPLARRADSEHLAYVIFTSGSTGIPKGAMLAQRGMINHLYAKVAELELSGGDVVAQNASQCFDISVWQFLAPLLVGARVHIVEDEIALDALGLLDEVDRRGVTILETVPSLLRAMFDGGGDDPAVRKLAALRWLIPTGEALPPALARRWLERYPRVPVLNAYGPTECSDDITHFALRSLPAASMARVPIGRAVANLELYVLDRRMRPVPAGVAGELYAGGVGVGRGYLRNPRQTAATFVADPFAHRPGARLYKTGDLVRTLPDGDLDFLARLDHQVKIRGYRIELGEIEIQLRAQPGVRETVVVARESASAPGDKRLVAYVVAEGRPAPAELAGGLRKVLPEYMVPAAFVVLDALPLTPNGKVDRAALPEPESTRPELTSGLIAPRDLIEEQLQQIWEELLGVSPVGVVDDFFELGGHSLLAVRMMAYLKETFGRELPLAVLFEGRTIEFLADLLRREAGALPQAPLVAMQPRGAKTPLFCVHPGDGTILGFFALARGLDPDRPVYGLQDPALYGGWDRDDVALEEMAARYVGEIRAVEPRGPYHLCGWSFGGQVAFEMARRLRAADCDVGLLTILDAPAPVDADEYAARHDDAMLLTIIVHELGVLIRPDELRRLEPQAQLEYAAAQGASAHRFVTPEWIRTRLELFKSRIRAVRDYEPGVYPGRITLVCSQERVAEQGRSAKADDPTLGWSALSTEEVTVHTVPGTHESMLAEPHVEVLAEFLRYGLGESGIGIKTSGLSFGENT